MIDEQKLETGLDACKHCGGRPRVEFKSSLTGMRPMRIACSECWIATDWSYDADVIVPVWNRRAAHPDSAKLRELEETSEIIADGYHAVGDKLDSLLKLVRPEPGCVRCIAAYRRADNGKRCCRLLETDETVKCAESGTRADCAIDAIISPEPKPKRDIAYLQRLAERIRET